MFLLQQARIMGDSDVAHTVEDAFQTMSDLIFTAMKNPSLNKKRLYVQERRPDLEEEMSFRQVKEVRQFSRASKPCFATYAGWSNKKQEALEGHLGCLAVAPTSRRTPGGGPSQRVRLGRRR